MALDCPEKTWLKKALKDGDLLGNWWALLPGTKGGEAPTDSRGKEGVQEKGQMKSELSEGMPR